MCSFSLFLSLLFLKRCDYIIGNKLRFIRFIDRILSGTYYITSHKLLHNAWIYYAYYLDENVNDLMIKSIINVFFEHK